MLLSEICGCYTPVELRRSFSTRYIYIYFMSQFPPSPTKKIILSDIYPKKDTL